MVDLMRMIPFSGAICLINLHNESICSTFLRVEHLPGVRTVEGSNLVLILISGHEKSIYLDFDISLMSLGTNVSLINSPFDDVTNFKHTLDKLGYHIDAKVQVLVQRFCKIMIDKK